MFYRKIGKQFEPKPRKAPLWFRLKWRWRFYKIRTALRIYLWFYPEEYDEMPEDLRVLLPRRP